MDSADKPRATRVAQITDGGSMVVLQDGSKWKIAPYFKQEVFESWRRGDEVAAREASDDPAYPFTIFNTAEGFGVAAKKLD